MQRTGKPSQPVDPKAEEKSIATAFAMFDVDGSGDIDSSELKKVAQELGVPMYEEDIAAAMAVMDGAGKKRLFCAVLCFKPEDLPSQARDKHEEKLRKRGVFSAGDGSGEVDLGEFTEWYRSLSEKKPGEKLSQMELLKVKSILVSSARRDDSC